MVRVCESNIIFPCVRRPSICLSCCLLLNHWAEFNQTCYITSPHGKDVREQHYFFVPLSSIDLSVMLSPPKPLGGIQPNLLHHFPSWLVCARATLFFHSPVRHPFICLLGYLLNHWVEFNQTCYMTSPRGKGVGEQICPSVMVLATLAKSVGICDGVPLTAHSSFCLFCIISVI